MEQTILQRKVNYIAPKIKTETYAENSYRQIRVAAYCRVSTQMEEQLNSYEVQVKHYTDKINSEPKWFLQESMQIKVSREQAPKSEMNL